MRVVDLTAHRRAQFTWDEAVATAMVQVATHRGVRMTREGLAIVQAVVDGICWVCAACMLMACTSSVPSPKPAREVAAISPGDAASLVGSEPEVLAVPEVIVRAPKPRPARTVWQQPEPERVTYCDPNALGGVTCETY